jgi:hypothetical protein
MKIRLGLGLASILVISAPGFAQEKLPPYRAVVYGTPYSATVVITTYQGLGDGTKIQHREVKYEARNSQGFQWYKVSVENKDPLRRNGKEYEAVIMWDPVHRTRVDWCTCNHVAWVKQYGDPAKAEPRREPGPAGMDILLGPYNDRQKFHLEKLEPQRLFELDTDVTRATRVVPAGLDGNNHDLVTTVTTWYSPQLQIPLVTITDDWKAGLTKTEVTTLSLAEPDPKIFVIPEGYAVKPSVDPVR